MGNLLLWWRYFALNVKPVAMAEVLPTAMVKNHKKCLDPISRLSLFLAIHISKITIVSSKSMGSLCYNVMFYGEGRPPHFFFFFFC